jgi:RNA polymerase-binding transcription factor DksA
MEHEDGYCDRCGAETPDEAWLRLDGQAWCRSCAESVEASTAIRAKRPEARDDGR